MKRCPKCKQPVPERKFAKLVAVRFCWECKTVMPRKDKFYFGMDGRLRHRHCDNPTSYLSRREAAWVAKHGWEAWRKRRVKVSA